MNSVELCQDRYSFFSTVDEIRQQAKAHLKEWKHTDPNSLVKSLLAILKSNQEQTARTQAVVAVHSALREFILHQKDAIWTRPGPRMCRTLQEELVPYLPHLIPSVLKVLNFEFQPVNDQKDGVENMLIVSKVDGKEEGLENSVIDGILPAVNLLSILIKVLGAQFGEYLVPTAESLLFLLSLRLNLDIKRSALTAIAEVFTVARELSSNNPVAARQRLRLWVGKVIEEVFKDPTLLDENDPAPMLGLMGGLRECLHNAGSDVLNAQEVGSICGMVFEFMEEFCTPEDDPDQVLFSTLCEIIVAVMSFHADLYLQAGAGSCRKFIKIHLDPNCIADDRSLALFVCGNVLEYLKDKGAPLWPTFASHLVESVGDPDHGVRRAAAFGLIQAAKCPQFPAELIQKAAVQLDALLNETQSQEKTFSCATDNMIAALGAIVLHRSSCLQPSPEQFLDLWISNLPLKVNNEEGRRVHGDFVDLLVQRSLEDLKAQNANLFKSAAICASIYRTDFSTAKIDEGIRDFMQKIGFDVISSVGANFDKKLQIDLERICRDVWPCPLNKCVNSLFPFIKAVDL